MPAIVIGWSMNEEIADSSVDRLAADVTERYATFFGNFSHREVHGPRQGLACFGPDIDTDPQVVGDGTFRLAALRGGGSITTPGRHPSKLHVQHALGLIGPQPALDDVNPPYCLAWTDLSKGEVGLMNDGIGMEQMFVWRSSRGTVFSNKCWAILEFLGEKPRLNAEAWRHWFVRGWFHANETGFNGIEVMEPSHMIVCGLNGTVTRSTDSLRNWLDARHHSSTEDLMAAATASFRNVVLAHAEPDRECSADLTGGFDTRAVCAAIIDSGVPCSFHTHGTIFSDDAITARRVARKAGLKWKLEGALAARSREPVGIAEVLQRFRRMIIWNEGEVEPNRFESFPLGAVRSGGSAQFYGGQTGISRGGYYAAELLSDPDMSPGTMADQILLKAAGEARSILAGGDDAVVETIAAGLSAGRAYGLSGFALLDFHLLMEGIRRWSVAHRACSPGDASVAPFMNVDHVRLAFALSAHAKSKSVFQRHLITAFAPALDTIPVNRRYRLAWISRLLPAGRQRSWLTRRLVTPSTADTVRQTTAAFLEDLLRRDSELFKLIDRKVAVDRCRAFRLGRNAHYYFVLRLIAFETWRLEYLA